MEHVKIIKDEQEILAIIIKRNFKSEGVKFFTPDDFSQQLAHMSHKKGKKIRPHVHNAINREVHFTQEALFVKKGKIKVDIYSGKRVYLSSHMLESGDVILLASGGHGFEVIEDLEMIEVKQGPYAGDQDKAHF